MKNITIILMCLLVVSCKTSEPIYEIGDQLIVNGKLHGTVIDIRNWTGNQISTSDYQILLDGCVAIWYDQEQVNPK